MKINPNKFIFLFEKFKNRKYNKTYASYLCFIAREDFLIFKSSPKLRVRIHKFYMISKSIAFPIISIQILVTPLLRN